MKATLILCVKDGGDRLSTCLDHIARLSGPDDLEIVLVDNGSTDASFERMAAFAETSRFKCVLLQCFTPGNGAGRNAAINEATGDLLLFIDGDCYVEENFAKDWLAIFSMSDIGYASGRIMRFNREHSMLGCNESRIEQLISASSFLRRGLIQGSNMAFTRPCIERAGLFDERFGAGTPFAGEEWDLALRASFAGFKGGHFRAPGVLHDHQRPNHVARERLEYYDYGAGAVYAKHMFGPKHPIVAYRFFCELRRLMDWRRIRRLLAGWADYYLRRPKAKL
jgi:glycosyltransferase involved in cell wall biosynthesis